MVPRSEEESYSDPAFRTRSDERFVLFLFPHEYESEFSGCWVEVVQLWVWRGRGDARFYSICTTFLVKVREVFCYFSGSTDDAGTVSPHVGHSVTASPLTYCPPSKPLTLKTVTTAFVEMLETLQHPTQHFPKSQSHTSYNWILQFITLSTHD